MAGTLYALLVGIDDYQPPVSPLSGCVADIEAMQQFLEARVHDASDRLQLRTLKNGQATRQSVIDAFREHLGKAGEGDTALFYYAGHGSQALTPDELAYLEPDGLDETLVCYDSRSADEHDLADKELVKLIAEVAERKPHTLLVLDSCHSGSATRSVDSVGVRRCPTDYRARPIESYLVTEADTRSTLVHLNANGQGGSDPARRSRSASSVASHWAQLPKGRHVVFSACQADEEAKEIIIAGKTRGVFSFYLMESLQQAGDSRSYRDLFNGISTLVRAKVSRQSPRIECTAVEDLDRPFLGGAVRAGPPYNTLSHDNDSGWQVDAGSIHGIPAALEDDSTRFAVFPIDVQDTEAMDQSIGSASVTSTGAATSSVSLAFKDGREPDTQKTYKAVVTSLPVPPTAVRFEGDTAVVEILRQALAKAGDGGKPSGLLVEKTDGAELVLAAKDRQLVITRAGDERPLSAVVQGQSAQSAAKAIGYLEHIARWMHMLELHNPVTRLPSDAVSAELYMNDEDGVEQRVDPASTGSDLRLDYRFVNGDWQAPTFRLKVQNNSDQRLYCMLFDLTDRFKISAEGLFPDGGVTLEAGQSAWAYEGKPIPVSVPDELWKAGLTEYKDVLKIIASTEACQASRFQQGNINVEYRPPATRGVAGMNTLERLMQRTMTRDIGGEPSSSDKLADWTSLEIGLTTVRPLAGVQVPKSNRTVVLAERVTVLGHATFEATARLSSEPNASRDLKAPRLPVWLKDDPDVVQPFNLAPSRSVESGLSVLELVDVRHHEAVTKEAPLVLRVATESDQQAPVIAIAYDAGSDLYLPVGFGTPGVGSMEIHIDRLPPPISGTRSLIGSIKIFFKRVLHERFGLGYDYPLLRAASADGERTANPDEVRARVATASRVILYVHGIIGDTAQMATSAFTGEGALPATAIGGGYDLVLTFDYENLGTAIEDTARLLKQRLDAVGLGADHGKTLHIVAHSMGGLVARWFIEQEGGKQSVQHLVMLGTPNNGSPWPSVEDWAAGAIGIGLNGLAKTVWPVRILSGLMAVFERAAGKSLAQLDAQSDVLTMLAASTDPGIPYSIIAGNTSLKPAALEAEGDEKSRFDRLIEALNLRRAMQLGVSAALFREPNDVAVSVASIIHLPEFNSRRDAQLIACDHMSYFSTHAGLSALAEALRDAPVVAATAGTDPVTG